MKDYKLFENTELNYPWSDYHRNQKITLTRLYNDLELVNYNGEEWVILYHYGSHDAWKEGKLDPKHMGKGKATRDDFNKTPFKITEFYVHNEDLETKFFSRQYDDFFKIKYPLKKLYPMFSDPLDFWTQGKLEGEYPGIASDIKRVMRAAKENGYDGVISNWLSINGVQKYRCDIWEIIPLREPYLIEHGDAGYLQVYA
jgi:hypothetical protein